MSYNGSDSGEALSSPPIREFVFDDENASKFADHGLADWQIDQLLDNEFLAVPNRKDRRGIYLLIGTDNGGTCIASPIEATATPGTWRPITAWPCKTTERAYFDRAKKRREPR